MTDMTNASQTDPSLRSTARQISARTTLGVVPLMLAATPMVLWVFRSSLDILAGLGISVLLGLAFWSLATGLRAQAEYDARDDAPRPPLPRKLMGACLLGLALACLATFQMPVWPSALLTGLAATVLCLTAFGTDPQRDKRRPADPPDGDDADIDKVDQLLDRMTRETTA